MLDFETALEKTLQATPAPEAVSLPIDSIQGLILAEEVRADSDVPPFTRSFMDGYALRSADVAECPKTLRAIGVQAAGQPIDVDVEPGTAVQIMTGAPLPAGADAVQMVEKTRRLSDSLVEILDGVVPGTHVSPRGSSVRRGEVVMRPGRFISPAEVAVLATFGQSRVKVFGPPRVSIVSTGDELVEVDATPKFGQIRNSNAHMLASQCRRLGITPSLLGTIQDTPASVKDCWETASQSNLVLFSGGVSAGEFDFVHGVLPDLNVEVVFHKVAIKPGKPVLLGKHPNGLIFGLPGNPVSAFVTFELFVRPALQKWMGHREVGLPLVEARLGRTVRQKPGRLCFKAGAASHRDGRYEVVPVETRGSADIVGFAEANALILIDAETSVVEAGRIVKTMLLPS